MFHIWVVIDGKDDHLFVMQLRAAGLAAGSTAWLSTKVLQSCQPLPTWLAELACGLWTHCMTVTLND